MVKIRARRRIRGSRRGITTVQWGVLAALIVVVSLIAIRSIGNNSSTKLNTTAGDIANPATLPSRFGS